MRWPALELQPDGPPAPPWSVQSWFNAPGPLQPGDFAGQVLVVHAFQMLCPGCVQHALPQMQRLESVFGPRGLAVVGLHTVFEHHAAMQPVSLQAFLHEYRIGHPVGVDAPTEDPADPLPQTMRRLQLQGTPSLLLVDQRGRLRAQAFGPQDDLRLGAAVGELLAESA